jgi:folate-dependent tRNA-U54 methylase TrmFO/GidA
VTAIPDGPAVIATGPLTSDALVQSVAALTGQEHLYFYDALAPIVSADSIDTSVAFRASRYGKGDADYINCPMTEEEYVRFVEALVGAERIPLRDFEREDAHFFEGCLPVEVLAARGRDALAFGPLRPVGLADPRTGLRPYAVVQLRQDNLAGTLYNLVGFQTNLRYGEQERVFRLIPGLEQAEFVPGTTMLGALCRYVSGADPAAFQPMKANFGLMSPLSPPVRNKRKRYQAYVARAMADLASQRVSESANLQIGKSANLQIGKSANRRVGE